MKKVIFISALAIAAAVSCTKSDIVDTKFDDAIGFNAYIGRDAMTKATVVNKDNIGTAGLYGFYTGGAVWTDESTANLWANEALNCTAGTVTNKKYWTNAEDQYSFMAFAPQTSTFLSNIPEGTTVKNPKVTYTVPNVIKSQIDLTYANAFDVTKAEVDAITVEEQKGKVLMPFHHALARLTVKAKDGSEVFDFDVKEINISGVFNTKGTLILANGEWEVADADKKSETYVIYKNEVEKTVTDPETNETTTVKEYDSYKSTNALTGELKDYAYYAEPTKSTVADNYLMMIPRKFKADQDTEGKYTNAATVTVKYTTFYQNQESTVNTATFPVTTDFQQGKAYAINLTFTKETEEIEFFVTVDNWEEGTTDAQGNNPQHKNEEIKA